MVNLRGSCIGLLLMSTICWPIQVTLKAVRKGQEVQCVPLHTPFSVELSITDVTHTMQPPQICGLDAFQHEGMHTKMHSFNGARTLTFGYQLRGKKKGEFTIGPVEMNIQGTKIQVPALTITVVDQPVAKNSDGAAMFARLTFNKTEAVVGEKIHGTLTLYSKDEQLKLQQVVEPEFEAVHIQHRQGPTLSRETVKGVTYQAYTWQWDMFAEQAGALEVPGYRIDVAVPEQDDDTPDIFKNFGFFSRMRYVAKRLYSNNVQLAIKPLPQTNSKIQALGVFNQFHASLNMHRANVGDGVVLTLALHGQAEADDLKSPDLHHMPDTLTWYESRHYHQNGIYYFEYIVQGLKKGLFQIPAQKFTYFDTKRRAYNSIETKPVELAIIGDGNRTIKTAPAMPVQHEATKNEVKKNNDNQMTIQPLASHGPIHYRASCMSWLMMLLMMSIVPGILLFRSRQIYLLARNAWPRHSLYDRALTAVKRAKQHHAPQQLYIIFETLFKQMSFGTTWPALPPKASITAQDRAAWDTFYRAISNYAFGGAEHAYDAALFSQAQEWIIWLKKL